MRRLVPTVRIFNILTFFCARTQRSGARIRISYSANRSIIDYETRVRRTGMYKCRGRQDADSGLVPFARPTEYGYEYKKERGFTLIELIAVIVILSILAMVGSGFMLRSAESYHQSVNRGKLIQKGRQAIEQMTRQLRISVPNSVAVSGNNLCIEWLPMVAGGNYLGELPDQENGAAATTSINAAPITFDLGTPRYVTVGALSAGELFSAAPVSLERYASLDASGIPNVINLGAAKQFQRNSVNQRVFIADLPQQFCINAGNLTQHENYTTVGNYPSATALSGSPPNAGILLADGVNINGETPFTIASGTEARNTIVNLEIPFEQGGERIVLRHQVMVRNVP